MLVFKEGLFGLISCGLGVTFRVVCCAARFFAFVLASALVL